MGGSLERLSCRYLLPLLQPIQFSVLLHRSLINYIACSYLPYSWCYVDTDDLHRKSREIGVNP